MALNIHLMKSQTGKLYIHVNTVSYKQFSIIMHNLGDISFKCMGIIIKICDI